MICASSGVCVYPVSKGPWAMTTAVHDCVRAHCFHRGPIDVLLLGYVYVCVWICVGLCVCDVAFRERERKTAFLYDYSEWR